MPAPKNSFKSALQQDKIQFGCWLGMADSYAAEVACTAGFDWLVIDGEHAPNDLRSILAQLQIVSASNAHPIVRLPVGETHRVKQILDAGAQTLLIPMVDSASQAESLVADTRYPPQGHRGIGAALTRSSKFNQISDYVATANDEICLIVQIETRAGLASLDDILKVNGVDGCFIGPADLAADMGFPGNHEAPEVQSAMYQALAKIRKAGKGAGILALGDAFIKESADSGANMIGVGIDILLFANAMRQLASRVKSNHG